MSALTPKADIGTQPRDVRFVPKADSCTAANPKLMRLEMPARLRVTEVNLEMDLHRKSPMEPMKQARREIDSLTARRKVAHLKGQGP
jgi:hypothetical protein